MGRPTPSTSNTTILNLYVLEISLYRQRTSTLADKPDAVFAVGPTLNCSKELDGVTDR